MGSPLGPLLADFFMSKLENTRLKKMIDTFRFYTRCVDDTMKAAHTSSWCAVKHFPEEFLTQMKPVAGKLVPTRG